MLININSNGAIKTAENLIKSNRTKHFDICYYFIRDEVSSGRINLAYIRSEDNIADPFTKPLPKPAHQCFVKLLRLDMQEELQDRLGKD